MWDYRETKLLKTFQEPISNDYCLYYGAQFIGTNHLMAAGSNKNVFKIKNKNIQTELARVNQLDRGVFCLDHRLI